MTRCVTQNKTTVKALQYFASNLIQRACIVEHVYLSCYRRHSRWMHGEVAFITAVKKRTCATHVLPNECEEYQSKMPDNKYFGARIFGSRQQQEQSQKTFYLLLWCSVLFQQCCLLVKNKKEKCPCKFSSSQSSHASHTHFSLRSLILTPSLSPWDACHAA